MAAGSTRCTPALLVAAAMLAVTACSAGSGNSVPVTTAAPLSGAPAIAWESCGDDLDCGTLEVPYDYDEPALGTFVLSLVRNRADDPVARIGTLLVNPGGPGFGGSILAEQAAFVYGRDLLDVFDIVGWDPRGTGDSTPAVDCVDDFDDYFTADPTPMDERGKEELVSQSRRFVDGCAQRSAEILPHISTRRAAMDIDTIRRSLGEATISYFGFSYGSELGATWATMYPDTVRAAVIDGAADPTLGALEAGLAQAVGFERELSKFLERCSGDPECAFHNGGETAAAFDALMAAIDADPLIADPDRTPVTLAVASIAVAQALYASSYWPTLERALADAQGGDGEGLLNLWDTYYQRAPDGTYGNELEAFLAISCVDAPWPRTVEETDAVNDDFLAVAPRVAPGFIGSYVCAFWPAGPDPASAVSYGGTTPILVVGTTGDSATPIEGTKKMAEVLGRSVLLTVDADQHTGYGANECVNRSVENYLVTLRAPKELFC